MIISCSQCGSQRRVKAGFNHNRWRYECKDCKYQFTQTKDKNATKRAFALYLYVVGLSMNAIGRMINVEPSTILYWVKNFALKTYENPTHKMKRWLSFMRGGIFCVQKNKVWVWKAYFWTIWELVDWECGSRGVQTLKKMLDWLQQLKVKVFFADNWEACVELILFELLVQAKAQMHGVERDNFRQRYWFARFCRKICVVSRLL